MLLTYQCRCPNCQSPIPFAGWHTDRGELRREHGEHLRLQCRDCLRKQLAPVDQCRAFPNKRLLTVVFFIALVGTGAIYWYLHLHVFPYATPFSLLDLGFILLLPYFVYVTFRAQQQKAAERFNRS